MVPTGSAAWRIAATCAGSSGPGLIGANAPDPLSTRYVLVPVSVIGPGFGASTRWITCSDYRQLDLAVGANAARKARHAPVRPRPAVAAAGRIPAPAVPRASQLAAIQHTFAERSTIVRTIVIQGIELTVDVGERIPALASLHGNHAARWHILQMRHRDVLNRRRAQPQASTRRRSTVSAASASPVASSSSM